MKRRHTYLSDVFLLLLELAVIVIHLLIKALAPINKVAWVDANLLEALGHHVGHNRLEVDVGHQWHIIPATTKLNVTGLSTQASRCREGKAQRQQGQVGWKEVGNRAGGGGGVGIGSGGVRGGRGADLQSKTVQAPNRMRWSLVCM